MRSGYTLPVISLTVSYVEITKLIQYHKLNRFVLPDFLSRGIYGVTLIGIFELQHLITEEISKPIQSDQTVSAERRLDFSNPYSFSSSISRR